MNSDERTQFEHHILLRSSGELSAADEAHLDAAITSDAELASFAEALLRLSPRAPRDFAAEAIAEVMRETAPRDFAASAIQRRPQRHSYLPWLAAAAAVVLLMSLPALMRPEPPTMRRTVAITRQLDAIEQELSITPRSRLPRHRLPL